MSNSDLDHPVIAAGPVPFSRPIEVDKVPEQGLDLAISASAEERSALAAFDRIPAIGRLEAEFHVARRGPAKFNVSGEMRAVVTQTCVVTLEPFDSEIVEAIDVDYAEGEAIPGAADAVAAAHSAPDSPEADDPPDPIIDGKIDLGALASEFLALGLDPYPRKPGAEFHSPLEGETPETPDSPFAILKKLNDLKK